MLFNLPLLKFRTNFKRITDEKIRWKHILNSAEWSWTFITYNDTDYFTR